MQWLKRFLTCRSNMLEPHFINTCKVQGTQQACNIEGDTDPVLQKLSPQGQRTHAVSYKKSWKDCAALQTVSMGSWGSTWAPRLLKRGSEWVKMEGIGKIWYFRGKEYRNVEMLPGWLWKEASSVWPQCRLWEGNSESWGWKGKLRQSREPWVPAKEEALTGLCSRIY